MKVYIAIVVTLSLIHQIITRRSAMSAAVEHLKNAAAKEHTVNLSVIALVRTMSAQFKDAKDDPATIEELATQMDADADALSAAVQENTPQATAPVAAVTDTSGPSANAPDSAPAAADTNP